MESPADQIAIRPDHRYRRHRPELTPLYAIVEQHLPALRDELQRQETTLPRFVLTELHHYYLRRGRLEYGFVRVKCNGCRQDPPKPPELFAER